MPGLFSRWQWLIAAFVKMSGYGTDELKNLGLLVAELDSETPQDE